MTMIEETITAPEQTNLSHAESHFATLLPDLLTGIIFPQLWQLDADRPYKERFLDLSVSAVSKHWRDAAAPILQDHCKKHPQLTAARQTLAQHVMDCVGDNGILPQDRLVTGIRRYLCAEQAGCFSMLANVDHWMPANADAVSMPPFFEIYQRWIFAETLDKAPPTPGYYALIYEPEIIKHQYFLLPEEFRQRWIILQQLCCGLTENHQQLFQRLRMASRVDECFLASTSIPTLYIFLVGMQMVADLLSDTIAILYARSQLEAQPPADIGLFFKLMPQNQLAALAPVITPRAGMVTLLINYLARNPSYQSDYTFPGLEHWLAHFTLNDITFLLKNTVLRAREAQLVSFILDYEVCRAWVTDKHLIEFASGDRVAEIVLNNAWARDRLVASQYKGLPAKETALYQVIKRRIQDNFVSSDAFGEIKQTLTGDLWCALAEGCGMLAYGEHILNNKTICEKIGGKRLFHLIDGRPKDEYKLMSQPWGAKLLNNQLTKVKVEALKRSCHRESKKQPEKTMPNDMRIRLNTLQPLGNPATTIKRRRILCESYRFDYVGASNLAVGLSPTDSQEPETPLKNYQRKKENLKEVIRDQTNTALKTKAQAVLEAAEVLEEVENKKPVAARQYDELASALRQTANALALGAEYPAFAGFRLRQEAKAYGNSSLAWRLLGAAMFSLGSGLMVLGILSVAITTVPSLGLGLAFGIGLITSGVSIGAVGVGIFYHGCQKSVSKTMDDLGKALEQRIA